MKLEERVAEATNDKKLKNDLIGEYQNFILAAISKTHIIQCRFLR